MTDIGGRTGEWRAGLTPFLGVTGIGGALVSVVTGKRCSLDTAFGIITGFGPVAEVVVTADESGSVLATILGVAGFGAITGLAIVTRRGG